MNFPEESVAVLSRTPGTLDALLRGLPDVWTKATEGPETWSPHDVMGHLIHCEKVDWMRRVTLILDHGPASPFAPLDREAQFEVNAARQLPDLLDEFAALRRDNLENLRLRNLQPNDLERTGTHPAFGLVTLRQLIATWTAHDLAHLLQISRTMAKRYKTEVGPWARYLSVMG
jgi:hypothetical protein